MAEEIIPRMYNDPEVKIRLSEVNLGLQKVKKTYPEQVRAGYEFKTNFPNDCVQDAKRRYEEQGLEVFVGDRAFWDNGVEDPKMKSLFTRKKEEATEGAD